MRKLFLILCAWMVAVVACCAALASACQAQTRIENVARADWSNGSIASNPVTVTVEAIAVTLTTYRPDVGSPLVFSVRTPLCQAVAPQAAAPIGPASAAGIGGVTPSTEVRAGEPLIFKLAAPSANRDPQAIDTVTVTLVTTSGDRETLVVSENAVNSGEFVGIIATRAAPPALATGDCALSLSADDKISIECRRDGTQKPIATAIIDTLVDPAGVAFDSEDGTPVSGARVTMLDAVTGLPAVVYAADGKTRYPSSIVTGQTVTDGAGQTYALPPGEYRFPQANAGRYRLKVEAPAPYVAPSSLTPIQFATLLRPGGQPFVVNGASYGEVFTLSGPAEVRIDIPLDRPPVAINLTKTASRGVASPGDRVVYTITARNPDTTHAKRGVILTDILPTVMRLRPDTIRVDGASDPAAVTIAADGRTITVDLGTIAAGAQRTLTYVLQVRPDAPAGQALNRARTIDVRGAESNASVAVRIDRDTIAARMTIVGRIMAGGCAAIPRVAAGIADVRVFLEDGSYAITDRDGRYHFEGVLPGRHVVQVDPTSLSPASSFVDCVRSTRSTGSAISRFVEGQGGALVTADFHAVISTQPGVARTDVPEPVSDRVAAAGERDWFADGKADISWLFPEPDHNPRAPAVRVAIRHLPGQKLTLFANGTPVDPVAFDGSRTEAAQRFAVSMWRGVPLGDGTTHLTAEVRGSDGALVTTLSRDVHFVRTAARAQYLPEKSVLVADGVRRPVLAVRLIDRDGRPVHAGTVGDIAVSAPYATAMEIDAEQARALTGLGRAKPVWHVTGDDGIAYIALAPTTVSGAVTITFSFRDRDTVRSQQVETWLEPGARAWTIVGLAEAGVDRAGLAGHIEAIERADKIRADGRIAFYAKGRILGKWLLTLAYDSAKRREDQRLSGAIDPNTYYTIYADRSERRFDAASTRKLYVKLERRQFYALFGDFETGFGETDLGRYTRTATGFKAEARGRRLAASGFAARIATRHRRDEIQGNGLSGPYALASRDVLANSEQIVIEVRDRLRSERIMDRRALTRFVDYEIDYAAGTIRFSAPVLSRSSDLNPQFIVADYEVDRDDSGALNGGARVRYDGKGGALRIGATVLHDDGDQGRTDLIATDLRLRLARDTEIRAELAASRGNRSLSGAANSQPGQSSGMAWQVEVEHHDRRFDLLGYARQQDLGFGLGQQNGAERGRRKIGADLRAKVTEQLSATASVWNDASLVDATTRRAAQLRLDYRGARTDFRIALAHAEDRLANGGAAVSTLIEGGATQRLFDNRLELDASSSLALGNAGSIDFPQRHRAGARFALNDSVTLVGTYELAHGDKIDARTARLGFDLKPWAGGRITSSVSDQMLSEYGRRSYAAYGLAQSFELGKHWTIDATIDGNRTLGGIDPATVVTVAQPVASGGFVGNGATLTEDFTALTLGLGYRGGRWSSTARAEYRLGSLGDRAALTLGLLRQLGEGQALGGLATWSRVQVGGTTTSVANVAVSAASRPASRQVAFLAKLEYRADSVSGAVRGATAPGGGVLLVTGDARSGRLLGSLSYDWAPYGRDETGLYQRSEIGIFLAARYTSDRIASYDLRGVTAVAGLDGHLGLADWLEVGVHATARGDLDGGTLAYAVGPVIGLRPAANMLVTAGWNFSGFADRDFAAERSTHHGAFLTARLKFDQTRFAFLGLSGR